MPNICVYFMGIKSVQHVAKEIHVLEETLMVINQD